MIDPGQKELRTYTRFPLEAPVRIRAYSLPPMVRASRRSRVVEGHIQNIGTGGVCVLTRQPLKVSQLLWGEIAFPGTPSGIPTLLQVRWLHKNSHGVRHRVGLRFVLHGGIPDILRAPSKV
jgi:hypothetical protein